MKSLDVTDFHSFPATRSGPGADHKPDTDRTQSGPTPDKTYTFAAIASLLSVNESTLRRRWWAEKLEPAFRYCPEPLRLIVRQSKSGNPVYEFTDWGLQIFREYKAALEEGLADHYLNVASDRYPAPAIPQVEAELLVEYGAIHPNTWSCPTTSPQDQMTVLTMLMHWPS